MYLDEERDALFLGAMDRVYRLNLGNISHSHCEHFDCRNHIRVLQPVDDGKRLYVCGTNAHSPRDWVINKGKERKKIFLCVLLVSNDRNSPLRLSPEPNFVGSFDVGEYVLFFFRETAVEYINCGKAVFSRVARVCKRDTGGKNILVHNWATYLKARLNCSLTGEFPFYFNEIQSVYRPDDDPDRFYAVFTTSSYGLTGSAICAFTLQDIQEAFRGKFKEQATSTSAWLPVLSSKVPEPRPGECRCVVGVFCFADSVLNFIRSHPLMDSAVSHEHGRPVFYTRETTFTRLAVHLVRQGERLYRVFYAGTAGGQVYKISQWSDGSGASSLLLDVWDVTPGDAIRLLELSERHQSLYAASDARVTQIGVVQCARRHTSCLRCVRDPYCGWSAETHSCKASGAADGLLQDVEGALPRVCDGAVARKQLAVTWGQSVHVSCFATPPPSGSAPPPPPHRAAPAAARPPPPLQWTHLDRAVIFRPDKYVETAAHGLVILAVTQQDAGRYDCLLDGRLLCSYNVTVNAERCGAPGRPQDYQRVYADWCHQLNKYKAAMHAWEQRQ
ncbi:hypothetical protein FOCC_FOCC003498, partial [Frankliniella occidentalis]